MKVKLLRKIRRLGANEIIINSITTRGSRTAGMSYSYDSNRYSDLFNLGDTKDDVIRKAQHIYWNQVRNHYIKNIKNEKRR